MASGKDKKGRVLRKGESFRITDEMYILIPIHSGKEDTYTQNVLLQLFDYRKEFAYRNNRKGIKMQEEFKEYTIFTTTNKEGKEIEMAVVDEFEFEHKNYVVSAVIEDNTINEDGLFIFRVKEMGDDFKIEKISGQVEYQKIAQAYMDMEE